LGEVATTNPGGTGNSRLWETTSFWEPLRGRDVAILPDNDEPGRKHADRVARAVQGYARSVKVLSLPALPAKVMSAIGYGREARAKDWQHS